MHACLYIKWHPYMDAKCKGPTCGKNLASTKIIVRLVVIKSSVNFVRKQYTSLELVTRKCFYLQRKLEKHFKVTVYLQIGNFLRISTFRLK